MLCRASQVHRRWPHRVLLGVCGGHVCVAAVSKCVCHIGLQHAGHTPLHKMVNVPITPDPAQPHPGFAMLMLLQDSGTHWACRCAEDPPGMVADRFRLSRISAVPLLWCYSSSRADAVGQLIPIRLGFFSSVDCCESGTGASCAFT